VLETPTFYLNNRRYEGPWDESSLAEAMLGSLGHRLHTATVDFVRWAPSAGLSLLLMSVVAILLSNSTFGSAFASWWHEPFGLHIGGRDFTMPVLEWINDGLLTIFFLVVGLEIKREFTVGRLATRQAAALPILAACGGMIAPAFIYLAVVPPGPWHAGWGDDDRHGYRLAVALIVLLGERVSIELRVFLTAAVIMDDLVAIALIALLYTDAIDMQYLLASLAVTGLLAAFNRWGVYRSLPYALVGVVLWACLHGSGLHATLAGVILAAVTPARPRQPVQLPDDDHIAFSGMVEQLGELRAVFFRAGGFLFIDTFTTRPRQRVTLQARILFIGGDSGIPEQHLSKLISKKEFCKIDSAMRFCNRFLLDLPLYRGQAVGYFTNRCL